MARIIQFAVSDKDLKVLHAALEAYKEPLRNASRKRTLLTRIATILGKKV